MKFVSLTIAGLIAVASPRVCAADFDGISGAVRSKIERVQLDINVQQQVDRIDAMTLTDLPAEYRNTSYLTQQAKAMYEKARECYQRGINLYSIDADTSGPLPSNGQSGVQFQAAKLYLHAGDKYAQLTPGGMSGDQLTATAGNDSAGDGNGSNDSRDGEASASPPDKPAIPDYDEVPADRLADFTGLGKRVYSQGFYVGSLVKGKRNGIGAVVRNDGYIYAGTWLDDQLTGLGTIFYASGNRYKGLLLNTQPNGRGTFWFKDGARYEGNFLNGEFNGRGKLTGR